jgi:hypothetical protein
MLLGTFKIRKFNTTFALQNGQNLCVLSFKDFETVRHIDSEKYKFFTFYLNFCYPGDISGLIVSGGQQIRNLRQNGSRKT